MNERLDALLALYDTNEWLLRKCPNDYEIMFENVVLFEKMTQCIPQEHCDEINLLVYGIRRV
jgi:hypothetical protein